MACQRVQNFLKGPLRAPRARAPSARRQKIRVRTPFSAFLAFLTQNASASTRVGTFSDIFLEQLEHYLGSHARSPEVKRALPSNLVTSLLFAQTGHKPLVHGWQGGASFRLEIALEAPNSAIFFRCAGSGRRAPPWIRHPNRHHHTCPVRTPR